MHADSSIPESMTRTERKKSVRIGGCLVMAAAGTTAPAGLVLCLSGKPVLNFRFRRNTSGAYDLPVDGYSGCGKDTQSHHGLEIGYFFDSGRDAGFPDNRRDDFFSLMAFETTGAKNRNVHVLLLEKRE